MKPHARSSLILALLAATSASSRALAYDRVQPPDLAVGQRATLSGSLSSTAYGPSDVSRGGFTVPGPFAAPKDRGPLLAQVFPTYSPDNGISPWGMGFSATLQLTRWRLSGSLQYDFTRGDELTGPFGHLTRGIDGNWYPVGLDTPVRVVAGANDTFVAYLPDGSVWTFGGAARVTTGRGTYAWHLTQVRDALGHQTTLTWSSNASGNLFLSQVDYGGRATLQYRITLAYEPVTLTDAAGNTLPKFVDYRSGAPLALDQRVTKVSVLARNAQTGAYGERWHYGLTYLQETVGAAFYLSQVSQVFASGEAAPPVVYTYTLKGASYATSQAVEVPELEQLFASLGVTEDILQPSHSAVIDADGDGNSDLELDDAARTLVFQQGSGTPDDPVHFATQPLQPAAAPACTADGQTGCVYSGCLPPVDGVTIAAPRMLSQLNPTDTTPQVLQFLYDSDAAATAISVCTRDGVRLTEQSVDSEWDQSDLVRFVDLNADHLPDLVRVSYGRYDVLPNTSHVTSAQTQAAWGAVVTGSIGDAQGNPFTPDAMWVSDVSGDGIPDLVGLWGDAIEVWHGLGNYQYLPNAQELRFVDRQGMPFTSLSNYHLIPADLNKDGLQDYFITNTDSLSSRFIKYFTNVGGSFVEVPVAALDGISFTASAPVIAALDGKGNLSVTVTDDGSAYSVQLDGPETGLMATADDGRGTVLSFQYARGPASPGIRHRSALLASMQAQSSGYDTMDYDYRYDQPTIHSIGQFLVGYGSVTRREGALPGAPLGTHVMTFLNGDDYSGLLASGRESDVRLPSVTKVESRSYTDETFQGIPYKRLAGSSAGWESVDGTARAINATTYDTFTNDFCASQTTLTTSHGTLVTQTARANPAALASNLHCLEASVVQSGSHADASLDFREARTIARDDYGRITQITTQGASGPLVQQSVAYDADGDPVRVTVPGKGTTAIAYDSTTKLASSVTAPDGVVTQVASRDPVTDAILDVLTDRGGMQWNDLAAHDGQERLAAHWTDLDGSSAQAPREKYEYSYASIDRPATVGVTTLVDVAGAVYRRTNELYTAANEKIAVAQLHDAGWVFDGFEARSRQANTVDRFLIANQAAGASLASLDFATLLAGTPTRVSRTVGSTFGPVVGSTAELHADVEMSTATSLTVDPRGFVVRTDTVNGGFATTTQLDPTMKDKLGYTDAAQTRWAYVYDAFDRLRAVILPDGTRHTVSVDEYGRTVSVVRDGIASTALTYAATSDGGTTDLVASETTSSAPPGGGGAPMLTTQVAYDASGRKTIETHVDLASGARKTFTYFYDGATAAAPSASGALGLLTGVTGDGYEKSFVYRADGKLLHRSITFDGWRTVGTEFAYRADGSVSDRVVTVLDAGGRVLSTTTHHDDVDSLGRLSASALDGAPLATYSYDDFGRPRETAFANGDDVDFTYDSFTREWIGTATLRAGDAWSGPAVMQLKRNSRGFIGEELLGVGSSAVRRTYTYSDQGFLVTSTDGSP